MADLEAGQLADQHARPVLMVFLSHDNVWHYGYWSRQDKFHAKRPPTRQRNFTAFSGVFAAMLADIARDGWSRIAKMTESEEEQPGS